MAKEVILPLRLLEGLRDRTVRTLRRVPIELGNYPYVTARLRAKKALLYLPETYNKLLQMEIPQIARFLGEGEYKEEILRLGTKYSGVDLIEMATRDNLAKVFAQIIGFCEGSLKDQVAKYLNRWDVWNVKTILRGKYFGASAKEIYEDLIPAGSLSGEFLQSLLEMEKVEEILAELEDTIFERAWSAVGKSPEEVEDLAEFEDVLQRFYYQDVLYAIRETSEASRHFLLFVRKEIDIVNLKTLLRARGRREKLEREIFVEGGLELKLKDLEELVQLDLPTLISRLARYSFYEDIASDLKEIESKGISAMMRRLEKLHLTEASRFSHLHPLTILPILDYIISKENEVENIRIIARGKESGLSNEVIKEMLVV